MMNRQTALSAALLVALAGAIATATPAPARAQTQAADDQVIVHNKSRTPGRLTLTYTTRMAGKKTVGPTMIGTDREHVFTIPTADTIGDRELVVDFTIGLTTHRACTLRLAPRQNYVVVAKDGPSTSPAVPSVPICESRVR